MAEASNSGMPEVKKELDDSNEDKVEDEPEVHRSESCDDPDPCPICLRKCQVEAKLDSCKHHFCFDHICEWVTRNATCPMCKARVRKVMYEFEEEGACKEVSVAELRSAAERKRIVNETQQPMDIERRELIFMIRHLQRVSRDNDAIIAKSDRTGSRASVAWAMKRRDILSRCHGYHMLLDNFDRPRASVIGDPTFRLLVYERRLIRRALVDSANASRHARQRLNISPNFFITNRAEQRPRIMPFIRRELAIITQGGAHTDTLCETVFEAMCQHQINSPAFTTALCRESSIRGDYADRFAQLLFEFAASGQDLEMFDQNSEYVSEDENRRRRYTDGEIYPDRDIRDDVQIFHTVPPTIDLETSPQPSSSRRTIAARRLDHNPFAALLNQFERDWSSHRLNSRTTRWLGRNRNENDGDNESVQLDSDEPQTSSARARREGGNSPSVADATGVEGDFSNFNGDLSAFVATNPVASSRWWNLPFGTLRNGINSNSRRNQNTPSVVDPQRNLGDHLAIFRQVFNDFRLGNETPLSRTLPPPVIRQVESNDSESSNEELYVRKECRLRRANSNPPSTVIEVDGDEEESSGSRVDSGMAWQHARPSTPASLQTSAAASSTLPISFSFNTAPSTSYVGSFATPASATSEGMALLDYVHANNDLHRPYVTTPDDNDIDDDDEIVQLDDTVNENTVDDDGIVQLDDTVDENLIDDDITIVPATPPLITIDDDIEDLSSPGLGTSAPSNSNANGRKAVNHKGHEPRCETASNNDSQLSSKRHSQTSSRDRNEPVTSMQKFNQILGDTMKGTDARVLAETASDDQLTQAEERLREANDLVQRVRAIMHPDSQASDAIAGNSRETGYHLRERLENGEQPSTSSSHPSSSSKKRKSHKADRKKRSHGKHRSTRDEDSVKKHSKRKDRKRRHSRTSDEVESDTKDRDGGDQKKGEYSDVSE